MKLLTCGSEEQEVIQFFNPEFSQLSGKVFLLKGENIAFLSST